MFMGALLPDKLYVLPATIAAGGNGASASGNNGISGTAGSSSSVSIYPNSTSDNVLIMARGGGAGGGGSSTSSSGGTAQGSPSGFNHPLSNMALSIFTTGGDNGLSGSQNIPSNKDVNIFIMGGVGGGGKTTSNVASSGGGYAKGSITWAISVSGPSANSQETGSVGFLVQSINYGGCGGAGNSTASGGNGGDGVVWGVGGGGGGGGTTAGGRGGNGGPGLVIIASW
jgi:hypothetical protein